MLNGLHGTKKSVAIEDREVRRDQESRSLCPQEKAYAPMLLVMAGFAGAGKTTLANRLHDRLQWKMLSKDDLKLKRLDDGEEVEQAGWNAFNDLFELIEQKAIIDGESVIIDTSNDKPFIFDNINQILHQMEKHHIRARLKVLLCAADKETRTHRLDERGSMFFPHVKEPPTILEDAEFLTRFNHLILKKEEKTLEYPISPLNDAELSERFKHFLKRAELPERFNYLLEDAKLPEHFSFLLKDTEFLEYFNHLLHKEKVYIVNTNPPLETYAESVLGEVWSEFTSPEGEQAYR
jgi:predicted kinase